MVVSRVAMRNLEGGGSYLDGCMECPPIRLRDRWVWHATHLVSMVLEKFNFLLGEGCHGDGLDSVGRVESSPEKDTGVEGASGTRFSREVSTNLTGNQ